MDSDQVRARIDSKDKNSGADTYRTRDYPPLAKLTHAWLEKYPQSRKREAALLLHARAVYRSSEEVMMKKFVTWPQGARWEGAYEISVSQREPFDAKRVLASFDAYDRALPRGRYAAEIRNLRAAVALRQREWKTALGLTVAQFDDREHPGLGGKVAKRLSQLFARFTDERYRADLLPVIKTDARSREFLGKFLDYEDSAHPLRSLKAWLRGQLAAKLSVPEGRWGLASGVSHRNRTPSEPAPAGAADRQANGLFRVSLPRM